MKSKLNLKKQLVELLKKEGLKLNEDECNLDSVVEGIEMINEGSQEGWSVEDWFYYTLRNYPEFFIEY